MTAFSSGTSALDSWTWTWDLRSVNARGLDLRLRVPDWVDGLELSLRGQLQKAMARGSVTLSLRLCHDAGKPDGPTADQIDAALMRIRAIHSRAAQQGMPMAPANATEILTLAGGQGAGQATPAQTKALRGALLIDFRENVLPAFVAMRAGEGATITAVIECQIAGIDALISTATAQAAARGPLVRDALTAALARVMEATDTDPARVAQELALLAVKGDVTEELDRLRAHVAAARALSGTAGPVGRQLDFLLQEFNREANTLCSKSQDKDLTATGLSLKTLIDQMREQVQNVE